MICEHVCATKESLVPKEFKQCIIFWGDYCVKLFGFGKHECPLLGLHLMNAKSNQSEEITLATNVVNDLAVL